MLIDKQTMPALQTLLLTTVEAWMLSDDAAIQVNPYDHDDSIRQVVIQQNRIGWRQLFNGRFGKAWSKHQDQYYDSRRKPGAKPNISTGKKWQISVILFVWDKWFTLWKQRNLEAHGHDSQTKALAMQSDLRRRLSIIYRHRLDYEPRVQDLLFETEDDHTQRHPPTVIQNWLTTHEQVFRDSARRFRARIRQGVQSILPFLTTR